MNERSILIVIDKGDVTKDIASYEILDNKVKIIFKNSSKPYSYSPWKVMIKHNPIFVMFDNKMVLYEGMPLLNIQEILDFGGMYKIFFENKETKIYEPSQIKIEPLGDEKNRAITLMDYWMDVAQYTKTDGEKEAFLMKQFAKLNVIHPNSVLSAYIKQVPVTLHESINDAVIFPFRFNLSQKRALEQALNSKISIIEGPPGTGKTQTILNILANTAIMKNKTVAVVSGNNAAVQNVKDKLQKNGYGFLAASLGNNDNRTTFFQSLPEYDVDEWKSEIPEKQIIGTINKLSERLNRLLELSNRKARLDQEISTYRLEQQHFKIHNNERNLEEMKLLFLRRQTPKKVISFLADEYFTGNRSSRFLHKAGLLLKYGFLDFKKLKENRLDLITRLQIKFYEAKLNELEEERSKISQELERDSFDDLLNQHETYSSILFKHRIYHKYQGKSPYKGNKKNYLKQFEGFIEHFPILLSTTHSLRSCIPHDYLFDYVIIDEASQVDLLTGVLALSCCKQAIIVGDTKQLPQIVNEKIQSKLKDTYVAEEYNYFKHNLLSSVLGIYGDKIPKVMLKEHYRCLPKIIGFCNHQYYENELIPFTTETDSNIPIRLHYTAIGNHMRRVTIKENEGTFNHREIDAVKEEILKELQLDKISNEDIGFATPYRLQVEEAESILEKNIEIDTVHKYQGREKPIMILSTVLDQTRYGQIGKKFVENPPLVNVAVSRAQKQFILVTDHALFRNSRKDIGNLIRYIEYNTFHEHITHSAVISVFDLLYSEYSERLNQLQNRLVSRSRFKSENIIWSILTDLIREDKYKCVRFGTQLYLKDLLNDTERLNEEEKLYVKNRASADFVIYDALNKQPVLIIEVDGFASHRNNQVQQKRDLLKNEICRKYQLPLLRLPTTGSNEIIKIRNKLDQILYGNEE